MRQISGAWLLAVMGGVGVCGSQPVNHHEPMTVRVLDGRGGVPLARVHLTLIAGYDERDLHHGLWQEEAITDNAGFAQVPDSLVNFSYLKVVVARHSMCIGDVSKSRFSMDSIRFAGLNSPNQCGVFTVENLSGVFVVFAKTKRSDWRPAKGAPLQPAGTDPKAAASVASISTRSLVQLPVLSATSAPSVTPDSSSSMDAKNSTSGPAPVLLPSHRTPPASSDAFRAAITAPAAAAPIQPDSVLTAAGLFLDDESAESFAARPEAADWSEWMCERHIPE